MAWAHSLPEVEVVERDGCFALFATGNGMWPSFISKDGDEHLDLAAEIASYLVDGEVFIVQKIEAEKLRYLGGWAKAVNSAGETLEVSIGDIYALVRERWNVIPTQAEY